MSAPAREKPATQQPTQPLPISGTLPHGGNWLMSRHSVLIIVPGIPLAAWVVGELVLRPYLLLTDEGRSDFAILAAPLVFVFVVGGGFLFARAISRGKDGRA